MSNRKPDVLSEYIPEVVIVKRPERKMVALTLEDHDKLSEMATRLNTSRTKLITALLALYDDVEV